MSFNHWGIRHRKDDSAVMEIPASCSACERSVLLAVQSFAGERWNPLSEPGDLLRNPKLAVLDVIPRAQPAEAPAHVPDDVARAFVEAAMCRRDHRPTAACSMYRRAMELGLKAFSPEVSAWKLEKRIDALASAHRITPELQDWAHALRLDGNDALHGDAEASMETADQMHHLCWFLLTYLYTLPKQVSEMRQRRG